MFEIMEIVDGWFLYPGDITKALALVTPPVSAI